MPGLLQEGRRGRRQASGAAGKRAAAPAASNAAIRAPAVRAAAPAASNTALSAAAVRAPAARSPAQLSASTAGATSLLSTTGGPAARPESAGLADDRCVCP